MTTYESKDREGACVFCKIAQKELSPIGDALFWEDEYHMAWLSPFPNTEGFTVVIPKKHYGSDCLAMPDDSLFSFLKAAKIVSKLLMLAMPDVGRVGLIMEGTGIDHAHIKLFPMHNTEHMKTGGEWKQIRSGIATYFETYEGYIMSNDGPRADQQALDSLLITLKNLSL